MAPKRHLESTRHAGQYDCEIAYEEMLAFFSSRRFRDKRYGYKAKIIQEAIEQNRRGYQPEYNDEVTAFVQAYYESFGRTHPELSMQGPKPRPANSDWIVFTPRTYPDGLWLCHQLFSGHVKLFFRGGASRIDEISVRYKDHLTDGMVIGTAGKSAAITISVPKVTPIENTFNDEADKVAVAMEAIRQLDALVKKVELVS